VVQAFTREEYEATVGPIANLFRGGAVLN